MPLDPQAALAIKVAGDLPGNMSVAELRRVYTEQRVKMLPPAPAVAIVRDESIPSAAGPVAARFYSPSEDERPRPLLVFFHGGGWMLGSVESYDAVCRRLAVKGDCAVLSVDYRLAPENNIPGAVMTPMQQPSGRRKTLPPCASIQALSQWEATAPVVTWRPCLRS